MAGEGLAASSLGSSPVTIWSNREKREERWAVFRSYIALELLVATAMGMLLAFRCSTSSTTPLRGWQEGSSWWSLCWWSSRYWGPV